MMAIKSKGGNPHGGHAAESNAALKKERRNSFNRIRVKLAIIPKESLRDRITNYQLEVQKKRPAICKPVFHLIEIICTLFQVGKVYIRKRGIHKILVFLGITRTCFFQLFIEIRIAGR